MRPGVGEYRRPVGLLLAIEQDISPADVRDDAYLTLNVLEKRYIRFGQPATSLIDFIRRIDTVVHWVLAS
jgi:hypothetical protein